MGHAHLKTIGVVTVGRSDYGIYLPILRRIDATKELDLRLFVSGMHLSPEFGLTVRVIERDGFPIAARVEMLLSSDTPEGIAKSMGIGLIGFAQAFSSARPDILLVLGDRFEMAAAALAALPFKIPVAHIHGGELTRGATDESLRHSITKLSHLHFVSTEEYARRVEQLGEEPWRITVSGAPSLDNIQTVSLPSSEELKRRYNLKLEPPPLLVTFHPATLQYERTEEQVTELVGALLEIDMPMVITMPNADTSGRIIIRKMKEFADRNDHVHVVDNLGTEDYFGLMSVSAAMVGNSSSGIIEAASFKLPVVNIGNRQEGRVRGANVIDVNNRWGDIAGGIRKAMSIEFKEGLKNLTNPYLRGNASELIVEKLVTTPLDDALMAKKFYDLAR